MNQCRLRVKPVGRLDLLLFPKFQGTLLRCGRTGK